MNNFIQIQNAFRSLHDIHGICFYLIVNPNFWSLKPVVKFREFHFFFGISWWLFGFQINSVINYDAVSEELTPEQLQELHDNLNSL